MREGDQATVRRRRDLDPPPGEAAVTVYQHVRQLAARGGRLDECLATLMSLVGYQRTPVESALGYAHARAGRPGADAADRTARWLLHGALSTGLFYRPEAPGRGLVQTGDPAGG